MTEEEITLEDILPMVLQLPENEQEKLMQILENERAAGRNESEKGEFNLPTKRQLSELKGLGKELWQKVDVKKYLDVERNSWER